MKVVWTQRARVGIRALHEHIATDSPINADRFTKRILDAVRVVANSPRIGKIFPGANDERIRQRIVQSQRVIYSIDDAAQTITILALVHVRQDLLGRDSMPWH